MRRALSAAHRLRTCKPLRLRSPTVRAPSHPLRRGAVNRPDTPWPQGSVSWSDKSSTSRSRVCPTFSPLYHSCFSPTTLWVRP